MSNKIENTATRLKRELRAIADPAIRESMQRFSKEPIRSIGVRTPDVRRLATAAAKEYRQAKLPFDPILATARTLWRGGTIEERSLAIFILSKFNRQFQPEHWRVLDEWVETLTNWGETDGLSGYLLFPFLDKRPGFIRRLKPWTRSRNRWRRRAAAVALVPLARRGKHHQAAYDICDRLAEDRDDMVEKAVGWLLKETSRAEPQAVADYLLDNSQRLSRTTIRYAAEKLPARLRKRVLSA
jgi:3-methyladenine DNA glycosylase AlkD